MEANAHQTDSTGVILTMLHRIHFDPHFEGWKKAARQALCSEWKPTEILWLSKAEIQKEFDLDHDLISPSTNKTFSIPRDFLSLAENASCHTHPQRWSTLYRVLWRLTHGENHLLCLKTDPDVTYLNQLQKQVGREIHKMRAFVRFRLLSLENESWYVAWFEPQFNILGKNIPFFTHRFQNMNWAILTIGRICQRQNQFRLLSKNLRYGFKRCIMNELLK